MSSTNSAAYDGQPRSNQKRKRHSSKKKKKKKKDKKKPVAASKEEQPSLQTGLKQVEENQTVSKSQEVAPDVTELLPPNHNRKRRRKSRKARRQRQQQQQQQQEDDEENNLLPESSNDTGNVKFVNVMVPKGMSGGQIFALPVTEQKHLYVKVPLNCESQDLIRVGVPRTLMKDLPAVREEDIENQDEETEPRKVESPKPSLLFGGDQATTAVAKPDGPPLLEGLGFQAAFKKAQSAALREYVVSLSSILKHDGPDLQDSLNIATKQARTVGGKYRYGAVVVSGPDFCPLVTGGSNYAKYGRKKLHAELSTLKGLAPQVTTRCVVLLCVN